ncbi:unnamed protein product [Owenia fusiformis]|uniref:Protein sleepless n=1 Tax=Owenia fusiformis TaxID=6347 RepID=A0A8S4PPN9_OWEFU|nr:unnamed protein product [Owenia fusiformis]
MASVQKVTESVLRMSMYVSSRSVYITFILYAAVIVVSGDKCYKCDDLLGKSECTDAFSFGVGDTDKQAECAYGCSKVKTETQVFGASGFSYVRACATESRDTKCTESGGFVLGTGAKITTCYCEGNLCNSATYRTTSTFLITVGLIMTAFYQLL